MTAPVVGIQGGRGSFNEEAANAHLPQILKIFTLRYLFTSANVLDALERREIAYGQFAIYNNHGGLYEESLNASAEHTFKIVARYSIPIRHALLVHADAEISDIVTVLTHDQVFKQCKRHLAERYPGLSTQIGKGELTDPAKVAEAIASGQIPRSVATISNAGLSEIHGLKILDSNLQDNSDNTSTFLLITK